MLKRVDRIAIAKGYSIRDAQTLLDIEGYKKPSLDWIWKRFRLIRKQRIKRIR